MDLTVSMEHEIYTKNCEEAYPVTGFPNSAVFDDVPTRLNESVITTKGGNEVPNFGKVCMVII